MTADILMDCSLEISIWDYERSTGSCFLGGVRMNLGTGRYQDKQCDWMDAIEKELHLWMKMIKNPGIAVKDVLPLRDRYTTVCEQVF